MVDLEVSFSEVEFSVSEGRRPQIESGRMLYGSASESKKMPEPRIGDILLFEAHPGVQTVAMFWGYQAEFFLEIWNYIRSHEDWCPECGHPKDLHSTVRDGCNHRWCTCERYYRDGLDAMIHRQFEQDIIADIEEAFDQRFEEEDEPSEPVEESFLNEGVLNRVPIMKSGPGGIEHYEH